VVVVDGVWKRFRANEYRPSLRHETAKILGRLVGKRVPEDTENPFWALQDVSFRVFPGETVGIVGRNGAGKSTLFRIMCGVSEPTLGNVEIHGRFAALIALGAGFNPELSGLDNIRMAASIQGLNRLETERLVEPVIEFSELGSAIEMPVKRYSSGMYARLGFSIALHTMPDIVFFDEVLAVGDAAFQRKCRKRILQFQAERRTMLFVSHSAAEVRYLCARAIWLDGGQVLQDGSAHDVLDAMEARFGLPSSRPAAQALQESLEAP